MNERTTSRRSLASLFYISEVEVENMESTSDLIDNNASVFGVIQIEPELPVSHSSNLIEEPSEFERSSIPSPDSPFGSLHLIDNDDETPQMKNQFACPNIADNLTERSDVHLEGGIHTTTRSPEVSDSPVNDEDDAIILFSPAFNTKSQSSPKLQEATSSDKRSLLKNKDALKSVFSSSSSSDTDEEPFSSAMPICPVLVLSKSPSSSSNSLEMEDEDKSMDPLALPSKSAGLPPRKSPLQDQSEEPSSSKVRPNEAEKTAPSRKPLKKLSMRRLQVSLARASDCNEKDVTAINHKATATINDLKQQSNDMLSVYAKLKQENHELFQAKKKLAGNIDDMPVLVPSMYSVVTFDPHYSDGEMGNDVDNDSGILDATVEPYKDSYDAPDLVSFESELPSGINNCGHSFCRFGSLCEGLHSKKNPPEHCGHSNCMLEPRCIQPDKPPPKGTSRIITPTDEYYTKSKGKQPMAAPSNVFSSAKAAPKPGIRLPDEACGDIKLKQKCSVRLLRLKVPSNPPADKTGTPAHPAQSVQAAVKNLTPVDSEQSTSAANKKLAPTPALPEATIPRRCFINLERLQTKPNVRVYCMVHSKYQCKCLQRYANSNKRKRGN